MKKTLIKELKQHFRSHRGERSMVDDWISSHLNQLQMEIYELSEKKVDTDSVQIVLDDFVNEARIILLATK